MRPMLKSLRPVREEDVLILVQEIGVQYRLEDPSEQIEDLLRFLDGTRELRQIHDAMRERWPGFSESELMDAVKALDAEGLLEDADAPTSLTGRELQRYGSGTAFFSTFATLDESRYGFQEKLRDSRVLLLGVGGLGSTLGLAMAGAGVGRLTLLDFDRVELRNLTRQFLYREQDVGGSKVGLAESRLRELNSDITIEAVERQITGPQDIEDLVSDVDLVLCGVDRPLPVRLWVNEACAAAGTPWISGGMTASRLLYYSVWPGRSACLVCHDPQGADDIVAGRMSEADLRPWATNRASGPMAAIVAGYVAVEALRYLTGFAPPAAAGRLWLVDLVTGASAVASEWRRREDCAVCSSTGSGGQGR